MNNLQNSASQRYSTFASSNSRGRTRGQMKPQAPLITTMASDITPSRCIVSISMAAGHRIIGRRILGHLHKIEMQEASIKDLLSTTKEVAHRIVVMATTEAHTLSDLHMHVSLSLKGKWSTTPCSLHSNQHYGK
jgi:hypothetical protein